MRIVATSDTHEKHGGLIVPDGDVFIHAGDFTMFGEDDWVRSFNGWLGRLPHKYKIVIAGNHDRFFDLARDTDEERLLYGAEQLTHATHYLLESGCAIEGKKFWGSPYTPFFHSDFWRFHYDPAMVRWDRIPKELDVLITHGPALNIGDLTLEGIHAGCYDLNRVIRDLHKTNDQPKYHVFGHIHEAYGVDDILADGGRTIHMNVSAVDRLYRLRENPCMVFDI